MAQANTIKLGDPTAPDTEIGPAANQPQYEKVLDYLEGVAAEGATFARGRENGIDASHEYTETKSVYVELTGGTRDPFRLG